MPGIGTNGRTLSSKSLAMMPGENIMWNNGGVWPGPHAINGMNFGLQQQAQFQPMMGGWAPVPGMMGQVGAMR